MTFIGNLMKNNIINKILFACAENAGRSQMAEAFFNRYSKEKGLNWLAESAGTIPAKKINPAVEKTMSEIGFDLSMNGTKMFEKGKAGSYAKIISFGCIVKSVLPKDIRSRIEEWHVEDPHGKNLDEIRKIRDEIKSHVIELFEKL